jgi:hypothetical protein
MRTFRSVSNSVGFLLVFLAPALVCAQSSLRGPEEPQAFRVEFSPNATCGDRDQFTEEILKRTERLRPAEPAERALTFLVNLAGASGGIRGQLAIREPDGNLSLRDVPGSDCAAVLSAMALIAALTVDPLARPDREVPAAARRRRPPALVKVPPPEVAPPEQRRPRPFVYGVGARVNVHGAVMPGVALGVGAHFAVQSERGSLFSPLLRAGVVFARRTDIEKDLATADFEWLTARIELCPLRIGSERVSLRPCAFVDAGRLKGSGEGIASQREQSVFWSASGAELSAEARLVGPLTLGAEVGVLLPFRRDRFYFAGPPDETVHRVPRAGLSAGVGLGLLFF